jgi:L-histidine Nalpha-methyltransferase / hercynylcysteine S-oxide synthase
MHNAHHGKIPASWAWTASHHQEAGSKTNGVENGPTNGLYNAYTNGTATAKEPTPVPDYFLRDKAVRTLYGLVPLKDALDWPVFASYDELAGCAAWMGGRIPTFEEARSIYTYVEEMKKDQAEKKLGRMVPAVNGYVP